MENVLKNVKFGDKFITNDGRCAVFVYAADDGVGEKIFNFVVGDGENVENVEIVEVNQLGACKSEWNQLRVVGKWNNVNTLPVVSEAKGKLFKDLHFGDIFKLSDGTLCVYDGINYADERFPYCFFVASNELSDIFSDINGNTLVSGPTCCAGLKGKNIVEKIS